MWSMPFTRDSIEAIPIHIIIGSVGEHMNSILQCFSISYNSQNTSAKLQTQISAFKTYLELFAFLQLFRTFHKWLLFAGIVEFSILIPTACSSFDFFAHFYSFETLLFVEQFNLNSNMISRVIASVDPFSVSLLFVVALPITNSSLDHRQVVWKCQYIQSPPIQIPIIIVIMSPR